MIKTSVTAPSSEVISKHIFADVKLKTETNQKALFAAAAFQPGDVITKFCADKIQKYATYLTLQTGTNRHITLKPDFLQYINHSCTPNAFFDTTGMELVCLQPIRPGDDITFFYPSTEWEMAQPFVCNCGTAACIQLINGASHLSVDTLSKYKLTDFIRQQVKQKLFL